MDPRCHGRQGKRTLRPARQGDGKDGSPCPIVILRADDAEYGVWLWHKVLRTAFAQLRPLPGELVHVEYLGRRQSLSTGFSYHAYQVDAPERKTGEPDWSALEGRPFAGF